MDYQSFEREKRAILALPIKSMEKEELEGIIYSNPSTVVYKMSVNSNRDVVQNNFKLVCIKVDETDEVDLLRTQYDICTNCKNLFVAKTGGHLIRHIVEWRCKRLEVPADAKKCMDKPIQDSKAHVLHKWNKKENDALKDALVKYALRQRVSFESTASDAMKSLIQDILKIADKRYSHPSLKNSFPSADTISRRSKQMYEETVAPSLYE